MRLILSAFHILSNGSIRVQYGVCHKRWEARRNIRNVTTAGDSIKTA